MQTNSQEKNEQLINDVVSKRSSIGFSKRLWEALPFASTVFSVLILLRIYLYLASQQSPFFSGQATAELGYGLVFDMWLVFLLWFTLACVKTLLTNRLPRLAIALNVLLVTLVIIGCIAADQYFLITGQALDRTFFYFSLEEIWIISGIQDRLSLGMIGGLLAIGTLVIVLFHWMKKKMASSLFSGHRFLSYIVVMVVLSSPLAIFKDAENETRQGLINNRFLFFIHDGLASFFQESASDRQVYLSDFKELHPGFYGGEKSKGVYPLYHNLGVDQGWENVFNKTSDGKPPPIVLIVVESMSSDFFGERSKNTGCLMAFMDSLSKKSIYYPNGFSTSQRTHNVLPAVLSSVPNVIDGNAFQQIAYPNHWGLPGLLKQYYYSRFYCGVSMEYLNMRGFFNYHNTDYLVSKWSKSSQRLNSEVDSPWGYPDGALFHQGVMETPSDGKVKGRQVMDIYLTISTHDPFVYPNKERYSEIVRKKSKEVVSEMYRKVVFSQAEGLGSFVYTDEQLRKFFQAWKRKKAYRNTIFIITGDHGSELYPINKLTKYNVPLVIYSPLLKKARTIRSFVSHLDIPPTLLSYLKQAYSMKVPEKTPFMGKNLPLTEQENGERFFLFMTNKLRSNELLFGKTAFLENKAYKVDQHLQIQEAPDGAVKQFLKRQINLYQLFSFYVINQNKLLPPSDHVKWYGASVWQKTASQKIPIESIDPAKKLNHLGTCTSRLNFQGKMKIQLCLNVICNKKKDVEDLPDLVISTRPFTWLKREWILFKAVRPVLLEKFKSGSTMKVAYTLEFDSRQIHHFQQNKSFAFMWNNKDLNTIPKFSNLEWRVYTQRR